MITLEHVSKSYDNGKTFAVNDVSLEIKEDETLVLLGSSGCGKTTLLKMINRLIEMTHGKITIDHRDIQTVDPVILRRSIGYAFQGIGLFPHMTVEENISIVLRLNKTKRAEQIARSRELLEMVDLNPDIYAKRFPYELSGGQKQRVGVARALADDPKHLLMDEPFGALDAINRDAMQMELLQLKTKLKKTIVFVTHDIFEAMRLGDRIAVMNRGHLEQVGKKEEIIHQPTTSFVRELIEKPKKQLIAFMDQLG